MIARYDLSRYPASFNFLEFLVASKTLGADHVCFDHSAGLLSKYPEVQRTNRILSILEPACELAGMTYSYGKPEGEFIDPGYHISAVLDAYKKNGYLAKLKTVLPPKDEKYTVTLRHLTRHPDRNSNREEWLRFAEKIGAFVIEDYMDKPIHLHERMAYYAGAKMNFFVANGPVVMCLFSDYPCVKFMARVNEKYLQQHGWWRNPLPWANENQHTLWCEDTRANLETCKQYL